jgi:hypoxanthine phosphoribosyltransferase
MKEKDTIVTDDGKFYNLLKSEEEIEVKIKVLAKKIKQDYSNTDKPPVLLFVAKGGLYFGIDLSRALTAIDFAYDIDFVQLRRNYPKDESQSLVDILSWPQSNLKGRHVIVIEDLIDKGPSLNFLYRKLLLLQPSPASIEFCPLFIKHHHNELFFQIKYYGWVIGPNWLIGRGMDDNGCYRGLRAVYQARKS